MKKRNYSKLILLFSIFLPFMDIYRAVIGNKFQIFGISLVEVFNTLFTFILFIMLLLKNKQDNNKLFTKKIFPIIIVYFIYILLHSIHILSFNDFIYINGNISVFAELYYIIRAYVLPLVILFIYMRSELKPKYILETLSKISFIFSIVIVISNIFNISFVGYSSNYEGNVTIIGNIFSWFKGLDISNVDLYTSKGLFYSTNQLSAIIGSLLFISSFYTFIKKEFKYHLSFFIKLLAAIMLSTKTAFIAIICSILSIFFYVFLEYAFNKKKVIDLNCLLFGLELLIMLFLFNYSPVKYKTLGYVDNMNNVDNISVSDETKCDYLIKDLGERYNLSLDDILDKEYLNEIEKDYLLNCIDVCPQKFSIPESYIEFYPVKENSDFWLDAIGLNVSDLTNYRKFKKSIYNDILNKHDNYMDKYLGIGYSSNFPYLERDFVGQDIWIGKIGTFLFVFPFVFIYIVCVFMFLMDVKKNINVMSFSFMLASSYMLLSSLIAGHIFGIFLTTSILSLLLVGLYNQLKLRDISIKNNRITFLLLHLGYGGIESSTINTANSLCDKYDIEIMSFYKLDKTQADKLNNKIKINYLYDGGPNKDDFITAIHSYNLFKVIKEGIKATGILIKKKYKVIKYIINCDSRYVVSTRYDFSVLLSKYGNSGAIKIAQEHHYHNNDKKYINILKNKYYGIDYLFALTKRLEDDYNEFLKHNKNTKVVLVPNMLNDIPNKESKLDKKNIITVSRLDYGKRNDAIISAFAKIEDKDYKLYIIGDGKEYANLSNMIKELGLEDRVILTGYKNKEEIEKYMLESCLFLMASETEGLPMVLLEAMSYGLPCIAYDIASGVNDIIDNNVNGFVIKNRNENEYVEKIEEIINDFKLRKRFGKAAKDKSKKFSKEEIVNIWKKILK